MYKLLVCLLFASPVLALPDSPMPKILPMPVVFVAQPKPIARERWIAKPETLAIIQLGAVLADYSTTARFSRHAHETDPIIVKLGGSHPGWGTLAPLAIADVGVSYLLARKYPKLRILQVVAIGVHFGCAGHNATLR